MSDEHTSLIDAAYHRGYDEGYTDALSQVKWHWDGKTIEEFTRWLEEIAGED